MSRDARRLIAALAQAPAAPAPPSPTAGGAVVAFSLLLIPAALLAASFWKAISSSRREMGHRGPLV